jgi:hypothetical protein
MVYGFDDVDDETIEIFKGNCVPGNGCPVVITAAGRRLDDQLVGEYYAFVCNRASTIYQQKASLPSTKFVLNNGQQTTLGPPFMIGFLARLAEEQLNSHLYEIQKSQSEPSLLEHAYCLDKTDLNQLLYVYLHGSYASHLRRITQRTKFKELSTLIRNLELMQVASMSEVESS